jgi:tRNA pseudouridine55 synthase
MIGTVMQRPPAYSAMKIGGRRAYKLARQGKPVELVARPVRIDGIQIVQYEWPLLRINVDCGRGTYIRAIARDLGEKLGVGGYLTQLRRTRVGDFRAENAVPVEKLELEGLETYLHDAMVKILDPAIVAGLVSTPPSPL